MKIVALSFALALLASIAQSVAGEANNQEYVRAFNTMGDSGIVWIDTLFGLIVIFLVDAAKVLGISYEEINIWGFIILLIIHPLITIVMFLWVLRLRKKIKRFES